MSDFETKRMKAEEIVREHADMIYRIALQNVKNPEDASDIFQEVCLSLLTKNAPLSDDVHIKNWLIRVTINKCKNFRKSLWQNKIEPIENHLELASHQGESVMEEIYSLPKNYLNVIYLYYYEEYTIGEIASILGKSQNTVNSQLQRARKKLKKTLEDGDN